MTANELVSPRRAQPIELIPITAPAEEFRAQGVVHPDSIGGWRWLFRNRAHNGLDRAFVRVGRRILVDVPAYLAALRAKRAA